MFFMKKRESSIYDPRYVDLINLLTKVRKERSITQQQLAGRIGIDRRNVSKVETCTRRLDIIELNDWLKVLGVKADLVKIIENAV